MKKIFLVTALFLNVVPSSAMDTPVNSHPTVPVYGKGAIIRNPPRLATDIIWRSFTRGFWVNTLCDNTFKQKALGNIAAIAYFKFFCKDRCCKIHRYVQAVGYMGGFIAGSLTRAALNRTLIPWTLRRVTNTLR